MADDVEVGVEIFTVRVGQEAVRELDDRFRKVHQKFSALIYQEPVDPPACLAALADLLGTVVGAAAALVSEEDSSKRLLRKLHMLLHIADGSPCDDVRHSSVPPEQRH